MVDPSTVVRWESGLSTPRPRVRPPLAAEIAIDLDELDRLLSCPSSCGREHRAADPTDPEDRAGDVQGLQDLSGFLVDDGHLSATRLPELVVPARVGRAEVDVVRAVTAGIAGVENRAGGPPVLRTGLGQLRWAGQMLGTPAPTATRASLLEAVGNLAEVVGFCALDAGDYWLAQRCFRFALRCANEGSCWPLRAAVFADLARVEARLGDLDAALSAIEVGQVRSDRISPAGRAVLSVMRARYLLLAGREREALGEIDKADREFDARDSTNEPAWLCYYDEAEHHGSVGQALLPLATASGHGEPVVSRLRDAVRLHTAEYPRSRLFSRLRLARLLVRVGDLEEVVELTTTALGEAEQIQSRRVTEELRELLRASNRYRGSPKMAAMRDQITQHLASRRKLDIKGVPTG